MKLQQSFLFALAFLTIGSLFGQGLSVGWRTGATYFTVNNETLNEEAKYVDGYNTAIALDWRFSPLLSFQPELHFIQKGVGFDIIDEGIEQDLTFKTSYLELPLLLKARLGNERARLTAFAGPTTAYAIDRSVTIESADSGKAKEDVEFVNSGPVQDRRWEFGLTGGIGLELKVGPGDFVVDARYSAGLTDDTHFTGDRPNDWVETKTKGCTVSIGYMIPIGR